MLSPALKALATKQNLLFLCFVLLLSYLTYFHRYWSPPNVYWDENYHIASAQKYLHGIYFMEQHPPLGKLLIALGEKMWHPNARSDQFVNTDYGTDFPAGFSYLGYRFFSALLSWWAAVLFFLIFLLIFKDGLMASLMSFLYIFDNALIVHTRGAMLEGPLTFFCALMILLFFLLYQEQNNRKMLPWLSLFFGMSFGLIVTTKVLGLIFILLVPALLYTFLPARRSSYKEMQNKLSYFVPLFVIGFIVPFTAVWQMHFSLGDKINPKLPDAGYYQASPQYKQLLATHRNNSLLAFPIMIRDSLKFVGHYNKGAPRLDLCKADENGSPWYFWPFGARAINYRWETPDSKSYRYLYLQSNPVVWFTGVLAVLLAVSLLLSSVFFPGKEKLRNRYLLLVFTGMYISYLIAISRIERVLYLYHYFIPLILTFILAALVVTELRTIGNKELTDSRRTTGLMILGGLIFAAFQFYRPLSYYEPLTDAQFKRRAIVPLWELTCINCKKTSGLVISCK